VHYGAIITDTTATPPVLAREAAEGKRQTTGRPELPNYQIKSKSDGALFEKALAVQRTAASRRTPNWWLSDKCEMPVDSMTQTCIPVS